MKKRITTINGKILTEGGSILELSNHELKVETTANGINIIDNKGNSLVKAVEFIDVTNEISESIGFTVVFSNDSDYSFSGPLNNIVSIPKLGESESLILLYMRLFDSATGLPLRNVIPYIKEIRPYTTENGSTIIYPTDFRFVEGAYVCTISYEIIEGIAENFYGTIVFGFEMIKQ